MPDKSGYIRRNFIRTEAGALYFGGYIPASQGILRSQMRVLGKYALVYLVSGEGIYRDVNGFESEIKPGNVILVTPTLGHQYGPVKDQNWEEFYFVFDGVMFDDLYRHKILSELNPIGSLMPVHLWSNRIKALMEKYFVSEPEMTFSLLTEIQLLMANAITKEPIQEANDWSTQTEMFIKNHLFETIDFESLAKDMSLGYENFRKLFKQEFGMPPTQYQLSLIMEKACKLLAEENLSIKDTAREVNFCDEFHFSKQFKKMVGVSPKEYKRLGQKQ